MSHTPQQPADGWQPHNQPPVYRPNEQPPTEEPPPWSPESQRLSQSGPQGPVEEDGTVKYVGGPGQQQVPPGYGPPPGVPVSPFDAPPQSPQHMPAADPFGGGGGIPVSGMPVSGMPPVSSIPASGMPVSGMPVSAPGGPGQYGQPPFGGGQFGPQGGQLVPVSGGGAQPWGAPDSIKRKKKGGKGPMWLIIAGIVVIAAALGVGGFILFQPDESTDPDGDQTGTISSPAEVAEEPAEAVRLNEASGLSVLASDQWAENTEAPAVFTDATGLGLADGTTLAYFGVLDPAAIGVTEDSGIGDLGDAFSAQLATHLGGTVGGDSVATPYRIDARAAEFRTFTVGETTVVTALIETQDGYVGFAGFAAAGQATSVEALRATLSFGS
jgi:hypothetical protein